MPSFNEPLKNWFGYTRRERRSTFILLMLTVAVIGMRFILPRQEIEVEEIPDELFASPVETMPGTKTVFRPEKSNRLPGTQNTRSLINLNSSDSATLEKLPGIGPVLSVRIIKYRNLLGGYSSVEQLREVYGLSEETFDLISSRISIDSSLIRKIRINTAGYREIIRFPYFEKHEVNAILKYRELNGRIEGINDLVENRLIADGKANKIRPYMEFDE